MADSRRQIVVGTLGLGFFLAMLRPPFFGALVSSSLPEPSVLRLSYDAALILIGGALLLSKDQIFKPFSQKRIASTAWWGAAITAFGVLLICVLGTLGVNLLAPYLLGVLCLCGGVAILTFSWFRRLADLDRSQIAPVLVAAFVASHILGRLDILPRGIEAALSSAYPVLSVLLMTLSFGPDGNSLHSSLASEASSKSGEFKRIRICTLALILVEILCGAFLRSRWAHGGIGYDPASSTVLTYLVSAAFGILFYLISKKSSTIAEGALTIGGVGLVGFVVSAVSFSMLPVQILSAVVTGLYSALLIFMMALIALWNLDGDRSPLYCAGVFLILYGLVSGITTTIVPTLLSYQGSSMPSEYFAPTGTIAGLILSFGIGIVLFALVILQRDAYLKALTELEPTKTERLETETPEQNDAESIHELAMERIAAQYGLTERERETASYIAKGYTTRRVAEELVVATSTVQSHSKSIYRKMGIHRKDELIQIVNEEKASS